MTRNDAAESRDEMDAGTGLSAAGRLASSRRILVLTPQFPFPPHQGTTIRNYNLVVGLARRHEVHLLSFGDPSLEERRRLESACVSVQVVPLPRRSMGRRLRGLFLSRLPDMAQRLPSPPFGATLGDLLERVDPDVLQVEGIELAPYLLQAASRRGASGRPWIVFDDHNAEYVLQQRAFETDARSVHPRRWVGAAYSLVQWRRLRAYERQTCRAADRVVAVSEADAQALRRLVPGLDPLVVPNGVDMGFYTDPSIPPAPSSIVQGPSSLLVFTGKMDFRPNVDAVLWFARQVLPLVRRAHPGACFLVVGKDPHPRLADLAKDPGVILTGRVDDVRPYIAAGSVYVVPLRIGGGTRLKVLEAMAMGKAIVSTSLGCEGFPVTSGQELILADAPEEFAAAVSSLLADVEGRARLGRSARQFAAAHYDWPLIIPLMERSYD